MKQLALAVFLVCVVSFACRSEEGMWPFDNIPRERWKAKYGVDLTDAWLKHVQLASVRFNVGGSGSFVSPDGLVLTNHHVAEDALAKISTETKDYLKDGFLARRREDEIKAPDMELNVLISFEDVTEKVLAGVRDGMTPAEARQARKRAIAAIESASKEETGLRSDVVSFYKGTRFHLLRYKRYTDVRLVFAPETSIAAFGGDPDNFNFPRFDLDMAFFRVYENGRPVRPEHFLTWARDGAREGDITFVSGHPGSTSRHDTSAQIEFERAVSLPSGIKWMSHMREALARYSKRGTEEARQVHDELDNFDNGLKEMRGALEGLKQDALIEQKRAAENAVRKRLAADPEALRQYNDALERIASALSSYRSIYKEQALLSENSGMFSDLANYARLLVRLPVEDAKPNAERLPEFQQARREELEMELFSPAPLYEDLEKLKIEESLNYVLEDLGPAHEVVKELLAGKSPRERASELVDGTKLKDPKYRKRLAADGAHAIEKSTDPFIVLALALDPAARRLRQRYETEIESVLHENEANLGRILHTLYGADLYPDVNFTLRLCIGAVKGYEEHGKAIPAFADLAGLYARATEHDEKEPFNLPESWKRRKSDLNLATPFNFVSTNDITGGNSGSPVINSKGELVGLVFDGNIYSLIGDYFFDETQNRTVSVDIRAMRMALEKVYDAQNLLEELSH